MGACIQCNGAVQGGAACAFAAGDYHTDSVDNTADQSARDECASADEPQRRRPCAAATGRPGPPSIRWRRCMLQHRTMPLPRQNLQRCLLQVIPQVPLIARETA